MAIVTGRQIGHYYDYFRDKEIVFTKSNLQMLRIDPRQIYIKCNGGQWPCIINSSSLMAAKIIIGSGSGFFVEMNKNKNANISLRYCFLDSNNSPIHFFVNCSIGDISKYYGTNELTIVTLNFTQRPPDDLIIRIGEFCEANENFSTRREDRIEINANSIRKLGLDKEETFIFIDNVPRRCIIKDLSFGGCRVLLVGVPKFLAGKPIGLKIDFSDTNESVIIPGIIPRAEFLEGRKDICSVGICYNGDAVPMPYKLHINNYITTYHKKMLNTQFADDSSENTANVNFAAQNVQAAQTQPAAVGNAVAAATQAATDAPVASAAPVQAETPSAAASSHEPITSKTTEQTHVVNTLESAESNVQ